MNFIADLHIHSRFSRATSRALSPRHLAAWARLKGIDVLGTADFTHPQWRAELAEQLVRDEESGLYRLAVAPEVLDGLEAGAPAVRPGPLFVPQTEISSIYKRGGRVRKVHNLVFTPTLEDAERLSRRLAQVGNLNADGRPILGLDSHDLLEMVLDCVPEGVLIPAHVWTPWFAIFGSRSGFDSMEDCFGDLSGHIFALETGLSSDPAMNRLVSRLDGYALISNSDAHSGPNLGREANRFAGRPSYQGMFAALRATAARQPQDGLDCRFLGTLEFYPDEGKYHLDGHRACHVALEPRESLRLGDICPVCGRPLTVGVLHRVLELADRDAPPPLPLEPEASHLIPLPEVLGELLGVGPATRSVRERYAALLRELGPELDILCRIPEADLRARWEPLGEAVARMRRGQVHRQGGYDGEYGVVRVFAPEELADARSRALPGLSAPSRRGRPRGRDSGDRVPDSTESSVSHAAANAAVRAAARTRTAAAAAPAAFSEEQRQALTAGPGPVLVLAGPGAGKTRVLIGRLQWLLEQGEDPRRLVAVTFTQRAAGELRERLEAARAGAPAARLLRCDTLHSLAWGRMCQALPEPPRLLGEDAAFALFCAANAPLPRREARSLWNALNLSRETGSLDREPPHSPLAQAAARYAARKRATRPACVDYADLLDWWLARALTMEDAARPRHLLVDEVQDLSPVQLALVRALLPASGAGFFGIGDPDQAIYGFRGAAGQSAASLRQCWPDLDVRRLCRSYRASQGVLDMARGLLGGKGQCGPLTASRDLRAELHLFSAPDERAEARWVAGRACRLLGASAHTLLDRQRGEDMAGLAGTLAPGDLAVLVRLRAQIPPLRAALEAAGIPCAAPAQDGFWRDPACARLLDAVRPEAAGELLAAPDAPPAAWRRATPPPPDMEIWLRGQPWAGEIFLAGQAWQSLCRLWRNCGSWPAFWERLAFLHEAELARSRAEHVQILTLHASKGLEFQAVFLPGLEDGLLPLRRERLFAGAEGENANLEEERRLLYVGLTRAARALFVSHCARRTIFGNTLALPPSPLLAPVAAFCRHSALTRHTRTERGQLSLL